MKISLLTVTLLMATGAARGQGTVNFANGAAGVNAPVTSATDGLPLSGPEWQAELLLVGEDASLQRVAGPVVFQNQDVAGYFFGGLVTLTNVQPGQTATFRIRAFNTNAPLENLSQPVTVTLGGEKMPPANLVGLQSWRIGLPRPELSIARSGEEVQLSWSKDFPNHVLETADHLSSTNWNLVSEPAATNNAWLSVKLPISSSAKYYRLRSN